MASMASNPMAAMMAMMGQQNPAAMSGFMPQMQQPMAFPQSMAPSAAMPQMPQDPASLPADASNGVMQMMMAQQMQFQQQMMDQEREKQDQYQQELDRQDVSQKGKGKGISNKPLVWPAALEANQPLKDQLVAFMEKFPFEDRHKDRLLAAMATRTDTFDEDIETLYMVMGAAKCPSALLVDSLKRMEDGTFQARDLDTRKQFRRAQEIKAEAIEAKKHIKSSGSVRQAFAEQQKAAHREMAANKEREYNEAEARKGRGKGGGRDNKEKRSRSRSRSKSRGRRSRSRSRSRRRR